jgi:hypothetical protein
MIAARLISCFTLFSAFTLAAHAQQIPPDPYTGSCGTVEANFSVKHAPSSPFPMQPPPGKALVYVIETMPPDIPFLTKKVNIGLDGAWLGATDTQSYISFPVDPGLHRLCAVYQGKAHALDDNDQTLLLQLNAEPGRIYYFRYKAFFLRDQQGFAFFNWVDENEGQLLLSRSKLAVSTLKQ